MPKDFKIYLTENISDELIEKTFERLHQVFTIRFRIVGIRIPPTHAWKQEFQGFDARVLLDSVLRDGFTFFIWMVEYPIYIEDTKVFGYAEPLKGGIASIHELTYPTLITKVVAHYVGRILGLVPCQNDCLMKEPQDLHTLIQQSNNLCPSCSARFRRLQVRFQ